MASVLLINEPPLQVLPTLAKAIGLNEAIILQQVHYWLNPQFNKNLFEDRHWVHNTFAQWEQQFTFWSIPTIKRIIGSLEEAGLLLSFYPRDFRRTKYYAINYDLLNGSYLQDAHPSAKIQEDAPNIYVTASEQQAPYPLDQIDPIDSIKMISSSVSTCNFRSDQNDTIDRINLIPSHYRENTTEITTENTPPPLSPPPYFSTRQAKEEEEENQESNLDFESQNSPSGNTQNLPSTYSTHISKEQELTDQEHQLFSEMINIWNQTVQQKLNPEQDVRLTDKRKTLLRQCLNEAFANLSNDQRLDAWRNYCTLIAGSRFLSGNNPNGFKVTFDWALIPDNAYKILEGAIYDKPEIVKKQQDALTPEEFSEELVRTLPSSKYLTQWVKMSLIIVKFIGQEKYRHWFSRVSLNEVTDKVATFLVEGQLTKDIITRQYTSELRCAVQSLYPKIHQIELKVVSSLWSNE